jgi:hypothetical protein
MTLGVRTDLSRPLKVETSQGAEILRSFYGNLYAHFGNFYFYC